MKYAINGKEYSEFDINKRCAGLMVDYEDIESNPFPDNATSVSYGDGTNWHDYNPCNNPADTWPIIEKVWDELNEVFIRDLDYVSQWKLLAKEHNCSKLVAACICFIEANDQ